MEDKIQRLSKRIYKNLGLNGYARMDLRLTDTGKIFAIEANPNPQLAYGEDFAESAHHMGLTYEGLLQRILNLGLQWRPRTSPSTAGDSARRASVYWRTSSCIS